MNRALFTLATIIGVISVFTWVISLATIGIDIVANFFDSPLLDESMFFYCIKLFFCSLLINVFANYLIKHYADILEINLEDDGE